MGRIVLCITVCGHFLLWGCTSKNDTVQLAHYPLDSIDGIINRSDTILDKNISSDGNGSLQIITNKPTTVRIFELGDIDVENARLIYQAGSAQKALPDRCTWRCGVTFPAKVSFSPGDWNPPCRGTLNGQHRKHLFFSRKVKILTI